MIIAIREETIADITVIRKVTKAAFAETTYSKGREQGIIDALREAGALALSLVAIIDGEIVGHVAFSVVSAEDDTTPWFALGPISVLPAYQLQGIGSKLIQAGFNELKERDALGCMLIGNPAYYKRFGFEHAPENAPENVPAEVFMVKLFREITPKGRLHYHPAFYDTI